MMKNRSVGAKVKVPQALKNLVAKSNFYLNSEMPAEFSVSFSK
jgi:hypothetical protein